MEEDLKLVKSVLTGDINSFELLVDKYEFNVLKFVYNLIKDKDAAQDIVQEVFITVYNKLYMYNNKYKFRNWILQIAKNKCIDYVRKYRKVYNVNIEEQVNIKSKETSPQEVLEFKEVKKVLEEFINEHIEEIDKNIILLRYSQDLTFKDISNILNINESTVKRRYYKSRARFRQVLEKRCK